MGFENIPLKREYGNQEIAAFGYVFESKEEYNWTKHLQKQLEDGLIKSWEYEPNTFIIGTTSRYGPTYYTPDFKVVGKKIGIQYHEVKAKLEQKDVKRFKKMAECYPDIYMVLVYPYPRKSGNQKRLIDNCKKYIKEIIYSRKVK